MGVMNAQIKQYLLYGAGLLFLMGLLNLYNYTHKLTPRQWRALRKLWETWRWPGLIALVVLIVGMVVILIWWYRRKAALARAEQAAINRQVAQGPTLLLLPRRDWPPTDPQKVALWSRLLEILPPQEHLAFEISGNNQGVAFSLHASEEAMPATVTQFMLEWTNVERRPISEKDPDPARPPEGWAAHFCELGPRQTDRAITPMSSDPLMAVLVELARLPDGARGLVQVMARADRATRAQLNQQAMSMRSSVQARAGQGAVDAGVKNLQTKRAKELEARTDRPFLQVMVRVSALASDPAQAQAVARSLARSLCAQFNQSNAVAILRAGDGAESLIARTFDGPARPWTDLEVGLLAHLPGSDALDFAPQLRTASAKSLPPTPALRIPLVALRAAVLQP
jgi:hypothetical protein